MSARGPAGGEVGARLPPSHLMQLLSRNRQPTTLEVKSRAVARTTSAASGRRSSRMGPPPPRKGPSSQPGARRDRPRAQALRDVLAAAHPRRRTQPARGCPVRRRGA